MSQDLLGGDRSRDESCLSREQVLSCESLPTLPSVAMELLDKTSNPNVSINEIAGLIQSDPGLSAKILKTVNSSFYGLSKPCPSIDRAITMLGLRAVKSLVLGFSVVNLSEGLGETFDLDVFWRHTILAAAGAREIGLLINHSEPDEMFTAGMFQNMGVLAMVVAAPQEYGQLLAKAGEDQCRLYELENQMLGFNHAEIGAQLARRWRMPEQIAQAVEQHHDYDEAQSDSQTVQAVILGSMAARVVIEEKDGQAMADLIFRLDRWFGFNESQVEQFLEGVMDAGRKFGRLLGQGVGALPNSQTLLARANEQLVEVQLATQREADNFQQQARDYQQAATTDGLTGIANRKCFDGLVEQAVAHAQANATAVSVLFCDADKFKWVNDTYGHQAGDVVLIEMARRLVGAVGDMGTVCRYGGEEFVVVLPGLCAKQAGQTAEALRLAIESEPFDLSQVPDAVPSLNRTISVGLAAWQPGDTDEVAAQELVQRADKAVYVAKQSGRNNVKCWAADLEDQPADVPVGDPAGAPGDVPGACAENAAAETCDYALSAGAKPAQGERSVLIVEDDPLALRLLEVMFSRVPGVHVASVDDGRKAIDYLRESHQPSHRRPDLIVCDLNVPGYNGLQIVRALQSNSRFNDIPVVVVTGSSDRRMWEQCQSAGAVGVYGKEEIGLDMEGWCRRVVEGIVKRAA